MPSLSALITGSISKRGHTRVPATDESLHRLVVFRRVTLWLRIQPIGSDGGAVIAPGLKYSPQREYEWPSLSSMEDMND